MFGPSFSFPSSLSPPHRSMTHFCPSLKTVEQHDYSVDLEHLENNNTWKCIRDGRRHVYTSWVGYKCVLKSPRPVATSRFGEGGSRRSSISPMERVTQDTGVCPEYVSPGFFCLRVQTTDSHSSQKNLPAEHHVVLGCGL